ncbi:Panacea domain-containing protein [Macrococcus epidermidis]|uniref:Panacea domain-containing protein n=1 Tax=Macrococcus epidermidis TaxID=1902580 RepID=UPI0020B787E4|nr:type II toxin-antitoxin system antitoxin SocA domain-containing protein [Macrococcus epidermidis]UTH16172.1 DUF4065 domain-containing protein [Macrococcus epidermidis]
MRELAKHILHIAHESDNPITNLQLQKIMYFTLGYMIKENISVDFAKQLFDSTKMEAWLYGPVVPEIYNDYKEFKSSPISDEGQISQHLNDYSEINDVITHMINLNPFDLVEISHKHKFWDENKDRIKTFSSKPVYNFRDLEEAFNES